MEAIQQFFNEGRALIEAGAEVLLLSKVGSTLVIIVVLFLLRLVILGVVNRKVSDINSQYT